MIGLGLDFLWKDRAILVLNVVSTTVGGWFVELLHILNRKIMPLYTFENTETGETWDDMMSIASK